MKSIKEQLCDDLKTISAAIGVAIMAWARTSAESGEKEIERLRKHVVGRGREARAGCRGTCAGDGRGIMVKMIERNGPEEPMDHASYSI